VLAETPTTRRATMDDRDGILIIAACARPSRVTRAATPVTRMKIRCWPGY